AAAIFPMELVSVGIMHYMALVPCVVSSLTAHAIASLLGVSGHFFEISNIPTFKLIPTLEITTVAVLCAFLSVIFCWFLHKTEETYKKIFPNPYIRIVAGGCLLMFLNSIIGQYHQNGISVGIIEECIRGTTVPMAFLFKMVLTSLTLGAGYKGGEIVPSLFIGASFGNLIGQISGINPAFCGAIGAISLFCGVTNCPISALLISFELFGYDGMPYYLLAIAFSYMLSGYSGVYRSQKIMYSKYKTDFINKHTL
ncbi:MAG: chloride channel protein, partial [Lachnospiraceae bacterium]|nr:chloride channel protein [Lachnospiraceae bacterium]